MTQKRSKITMLGGIFFLIIIIGAATDGKPVFLIGIAGTALIFFIGYLWQKAKIGEQENIVHKEGKSPILYLIACYIVFALTIYFGAIFNGSMSGAKTDGITTNLAILLIVFCMHIIILFLRKKLPEQEVTPPTEEEILFKNTQQQSHIQLLSIFIPIILIVGAIHGDPSVLVTIFILLSIILFAYLAWKKRYVEQEAFYIQEKKILFGHAAFGLISAALILYFNLAK